MSRLNGLHKRYTVVRAALIATSAWYQDDGTLVCTRAYQYEIRDCIDGTPLGYAWGQTPLDALTVWHQNQEMETAMKGGAS